MVEKKKNNKQRMKDLQKARDKAHKIKQIEKKEEEKAFKKLPIKEKRRIMMQKNRKKVLELNKKLIIRIDKKLDETKAHGFLKTMGLKIDSNKAQKLLMSLDHNTKTVVSLAIAEFEYCLKQGEIELSNSNRNLYIWSRILLGSISKCQQNGIELHDVIGDIVPVVNDFEDMVSKEELKFHIEEDDTKDEW